MVAVMGGGGFERLIARSPTTSENLVFSLHSQRSLVG